MVDALYAFTDCETSISVSLLVIDGELPRIMSVAEVLRHNVDRLVEILRAQLRVEEREVGDRLHARTLERIFIQHRIYQAIEEERTQEGVERAVLEGLAPHRESIGREITPEDVEALLRIPIRRISLYDMERTGREMRELAARLKRIRRDLREIVEYAIRYLEELIERCREDFPRRTEITSFERVEAREAARRDLRLCYDRASGYLGHQVTGSHVADVSPYDRVLVIRGDGTWSVIDAPDKLFVGKGMAWAGLPDKERVFTAVFRDAKGGPASSAAASTRSSSTAPMPWCRRGRSCSGSPPTRRPPWSWSTSRSRGCGCFRRASPSPTTRCAASGPAASA